MGKGKARQRARKHQQKRKSQSSNKHIVPHKSKEDTDYSEWWMQAYYGWGWDVGDDKIRPIANMIFGNGYYCVGDQKKATDGEVQDKGMQER